MESVSAAAIEVLVQKLIEVSNEEYSLIRDLEEDAQQLQTNLSIIQGYLNDADSKSIHEEAVKIWLRKLGSVVSDAGIVLDELSYHLLHKKVNKMKTPKDKVLSCFSSFDHIARPRNTAVRIKQINKAFESLNKLANELSLQSIVVNAPAAAPDVSFETDSFTLDPIFIGRDDDVPILVEKLTEIPEQFSILAIVGMGGMGKTTLTRKVFNHENIKARFGSHIWVHVSQTFDPIILFKKILLKLTPQSTDGVESRESILEKLHKALQAKTNYLLVLDDVWNEDVPKWEGFMNSLSGVTSTNGNAIIITTRNQNVASIVRPLHIHPLNGLSDEECWFVIKSKSFANGEVPPGFEIIGRKIAKRCQGLPLAANVVGGVLRCKSEEEWRFINEKWLSDGEGGENISKILKLSFDHLPSSSLKKCFSYCSIFPKGEKIKKQELIEVWMGEGFLQPDERNEMEFVGNKFINVFLHNSLLLVAGRDGFGNVKSYVMHDLVHDLAYSVLGSSNNADCSTPVRYVTLEESTKIPKQVAKHLGTLFCEGKVSGTIFSNFECLHVLKIMSFEVKKLPNSIRKLIHLRNLNISNTSIRKLPDWIGELHHLQTLRADTTGVDCKLPSTLKYLINLRHLLCCDYVKLPAEIGRLTCLQTLMQFRVGVKKGYRIEELGSLNNLKGKLVIYNVQKVRDKEEALKAKIFQKPNLLDLQFEWDPCMKGEINDESVLEGLQPHANANLKKLRISGFGGKRFPLWIMKMAVRDGPQSSWVLLKNLIELQLDKCLECEEIPTLDLLPNLKSLSLEGLKKVRFISSSFNKLTSLNVKELDGLECLPDWLFYNNQDLSRLVISGCPVLRELPDGLHTLNSLEYLTISDCPNVKSMGFPSEGRVSKGIFLRELRIERCRGLMELPRQLVESSLEILSLKGLSNLENLPMVMDCLAKSARLRRLTISGVPKFMATGSVESWDLGRLSMLAIDVSVEWSRKSCVGIEETVDGILQGCCHSLTWLSLTGVENWEWVPASIQHLTSLGFLALGNLGVEELPQWFENLSSVWEIRLYSCKKLRSLQAGGALERLPKLRFLDITDCPELHIDSEWRKNRRFRIHISR